MKTMHTEEGKVIEIKMDKNLFGKNDALVRENLKHLDEKGIYAVDVLGSIGSGKTSIIQQLVDHLKGKYRTAAITGDITTTIDADRIKEKGAHVLQINTDGGCHLDANMVKNALSVMELDELDLIFVENVGNLICPGGWPVGAHQRIVIVSVTEGPYMIVKHPYIFRDASVLAINKIDLADAMEVDADQLKRDALNIKPGIKVVFTNGRTGQGIPELIESLKLPAK
jgi:hydrogenase nickel incorporation protein HypB